jgi:hypothetical protein
MMSWVGRVVGVSFVDPDNRKRTMLRALCEERGLVNPGDLDHPETLALVILRNPRNKFDANACEVHVPALESMIGHLPKEIAAELAPIMDGGGRVQAELTGIFIAHGAPHNYGIGVAVWEVAGDG